MLDTAMVEQLVYPLPSTRVDLISITAHALNNQLYALTKAVWFCCKLYHRTALK